MFAKPTVIKMLHACVIILMILGALANFYRNRDPYKAYFHQRSDSYLTTHLIDSELKPYSCLEYRLRGFPTDPFYKAIGKTYPKKQLILPDEFFFNIDRLKVQTRGNIMLHGKQLSIPGPAITHLLREAKYSFLYSPLSFSTYSVDFSGHCREYSSPWEEGTFPIMMILLPPGTGDDPAVVALHQGKYLFFIPSRHPALTGIYDK